LYQQPMEYFIKIKQKNSIIFGCTFDIHHIIHAFIYILDC
jgi:hypothetical protein